MRRFLALAVGILAMFPTASSALTSSSVPDRAPAVVASVADPWYLTYTHRHPWLVCVRRHETPGVPEGGYTYPEYRGHPYSGAYQVTRGISSAAAGMDGNPYLAWRPANTWSARDQDRIFLHYGYATGGRAWAPDGCNGYLR